MKTAYPKISIITVSFNQGRFIEENILSVINQGYPSVEHIIIDAGSTDETLDILKKYDKNLIWTSEPDKGQSDGLNKGFKKASGEIIGWINSDDRLAPDALRKVAHFFQNNPEELAVVGNQAILDERGNLKRIVKSCPYSFDYLVNQAKGITQNSTFFKWKVFDEIGYINEKLQYVMDRDLFIRIAKMRMIPYINETLAEFRLQHESKTSQGTFYFAKELIKIRLQYGGRFFSSGNMNDLYILITEPLRRVSWARAIVRYLKGIRR